MKLALHFCCNAIFHLQVFEISLESAIVHAYQCSQLLDIYIFDIFCSTIFHFRYLKNPQSEKSFFLIINHGDPDYVPIRKGIKYLVFLILRRF